METNKMIVLCVLMAVAYIAILRLTIYFAVKSAISEQTKILIRTMKILEGVLEMTGGDIKEVDKTPKTKDIPMQLYADRLGKSNIKAQ